MKRSAIALPIALFASALALRPQVIGVGPLIPEIQDDLDISHAEAGLLATIPVLCMGLFALPAPYLLGRLGTRWAITFCLGLIAAFGLARAVAPAAAGVIALTVGVGIGMGLAGALMPIAAKERLAHRPAFGTGIYALGIQIGAALSASLAVPIAAIAWGWRGALLTFSIATVVLAVVWFTLSGREQGRDPGLAHPPRLPWRSGLAWLLVTIFFLMAVLYYGFISWVADAYVEGGWSEERAGWLVAVVTVTAVPATGFYAWLGDRLGSRRLYLVVGSALAFGAVVGVILLPDGGFGWAVVFGISAGLLFPALMILPLDVADDPASVGAVAAMMLGAGFTLGALGPLILGAIRDLSGDFTASLWLLAGVIVLVGVICATLSPERLRRGVRFELSTGSGERESARWWRAPRPPVA